MKFLLTITLFLMHCIGFCQDSVILKQNKSDQINIIRKEVAKEDKPIWVDLINNNLGAVLSATVAILALIWGRQELRKKLLEKNITDKLSEMQSSNVSLAKMSQKLIDKHFFELKKVRKRLSKKDVEAILEEINELFYESFKCSSEAYTLCLLLKKTLEYILIEWKDAQMPNKSTDAIVLDTIIFSEDMSSFLLSLLDKINVYCTKVIEVPTTIKSEKSHIVIPKLKGLIPDSEVTEFKRFNLGEITNKNATVFALFADSVNSNSGHNISIKKASHLALGYNIVPIIIQLFVNEFYAPPKLAKRLDFKMSEKIGVNPQFTLIGFRNQTKHINKNDTPVKVTEFFYSVFGVLRFVNSQFSKETLQNEFIDCLNKNSKFDFAKILEVWVEEQSQTITVVLERNYVQDVFKKNKKWIKSIIKNPDLLKDS